MIDSSRCLLCYAMLCRTTRWVCICASNGLTRGLVSARPLTTTARCWSWRTRPGNESGSRKWCSATRRAQAFTTSLPPIAWCDCMTQDTCGTSPSKYRTTSVEPEANVFRILNFFLKVCFVNFLSRSFVQRKLVIHVGFLAHVVYQVFHTWIIPSFWNPLVRIVLL